MWILHLWKCLVDVTSNVVGASGSEESYTYFVRKRSSDGSDDSAFVDTGRNIVLRVDDGNNGVFDFINEQ